MFLIEQKTYPVWHSQDLSIVFSGLLVIEVIFHVHERNVALFCGGDVERTSFGRVGCELVTPTSFEVKRVQDQDHHVSDIVCKEKLRSFTSYLQRYSIR